MNWIYNADIEILYFITCEKSIYQYCLSENCFNCQFYSYGASFDKRMYSKYDSNKFFKLLKVQGIQI